MSKRQDIFLLCRVTKSCNTKNICDFLPCPAKKSLAAGHPAIFQTSPGPAGRAIPHAAAKL